MKFILLWNIENVIVNRIAGKICSTTLHVL